MGVGDVGRARIEETAEGKDRDGGATFQRGGARLKLPPESRIRAHGRFAPRCFVEGVQVDRSWSRTAKVDVGQNRHERNGLSSTSKKYFFETLTPARSFFNEPGAQSQERDRFHCGMIANLHAEVVALECGGLSPLFPRSTPFLTAGMNSDPASGSKLPHSKLPWPHAPPRRRGNR